MAKCGCVVYLSRFAVSHKIARMSHARPLPLLVVFALLAIVAVDSAPAPPKRSEIRETKMVHERNIIIKRLPYAYYYPFNLWPLPKHQIDALADSEELLQMRKTIEDMIKVG